MCSMPKRVLKSVNEIIAILGGPTAVADRFNIGQSAVSNWIMRGEIPPGWHLRIYLEAEKRDMEIDPEVFGIDQETAPAAKKKLRGGARAKRGAESQAA